MGHFYSIFYNLKEKEEIFKPNNFVLRDTMSCTQKRILLIGTEGSGKSSFVNSVYTAVSGVYQERAKCGGGSAVPVSKFFKRYDVSECEDKPATKTFKKHQLPVIYDMPRLPPNNIATDRFSAVLKIILRGRLPLSTKVHDLLSNEEAEIPECDDGDPIDRVVFVTAADEELPTEICKSVMRVCEEVLGEELTVFGILTKWDRLKSKKEKLVKYNQFLEMLHASGTPYKVLAMSNYCAESCGIREKWRNKKEIDDPILDFLAEICRPEYDPETTHETVP